MKFPSETLYCHLSVVAPDPADQHLIEETAIRLSGCADEIQAAAYTLAGRQSGTLVAELILEAARIERIVQSLRKNGAAGAG